MKKIFAILLAAVLVITCGIRFYFVNMDIDTSVIQVFPKGEEVEVGEDFFYYSDECMDGYTFTVLDAEFMPTEDFFSRYHEEEKAEIFDDFVDYLYTVKVSVANKDNPYGEEKGIALPYCNLKGTDYILNFEDVCFEIANPDMPGTSFALRQNSSLEMLLVYAVMSSQTSIEHISEDAPKLMISDYPHQKLLELY